MKIYQLVYSHLQVLAIGTECLTSKEIVNSYCSVGETNFKCLVKSKFVLKFNKTITALLIFVSIGMIR